MVLEFSKRTIEIGGVMSYLESVLEFELTKLAAQHYDWAGMPTSLTDIWKHLQQRNIKASLDEIAECLTSLYRSRKIVLQKFWTNDMRWVLFQADECPKNFFWGQFRILTLNAAKEAEFHR